MPSKIRVRFAPSPTGPLHIGGVRTALYNYLFAAKMGGTFILRIEDTDQNRYVPGAEEYIIRSLDWAGLMHTEGLGIGGEFGPYRQSERKSIYRQYAMKLIDSGHAYYAFDTPEELNEMRERMRNQGIPSPQYNAISRQYMKNSDSLPREETQARLDRGDQYVIRIKMPRKEEVKFEDLIRGWVLFQSEQLDDKVLFKSDGMPTYHLANVVDDYLMQISHVIRGEEWLPSTPLHVLLYRYLGWESSMPQFAHLPLILRPDGKGKLSKRDGDRLGFPVFPLDWKNIQNGDSASGFRERGFFPEPFINMLAFLGWNPGTEQEIFSKEALIDAFEIGKINKSGARFDFEKAKWYNQQYIKSLPDAKLADNLLPMLKEAGFERSTDYIIEVCRLLKERVHFLNDFLLEGSYFFQLPSSYDEKTINKKWNEASQNFFFELLATFKSSLHWDAANIEMLVKSMINQKELKFGAILPLFRVMLCGTPAGPPIFEVAALLGKEETLQRMDTFIKRNKLKNET